jgi:uncharacterized Zn finger protein
MSGTRDFGTTWWGRAWINALENAGPGYESRLPRGRTYARRGAVREIELLPGHISSRVVGRTGELYRVDIAVRKLADAEWGQVAEAIAARAAHLAALLDGEMDPGIAEDAEAVDVQLLPRASDLRPDCTCPDWAEPCKHAAATCYVVATELDRDPFALFLIRGIGRDELIAMVRSRRSGATTAPERADPARQGVPSSTAWHGRSIGDAPTAPPAEATGLHYTSIAHPGHVTPWDADIPAKQAVDPARIDELAEDAVHRAWTMLVDGAPSGLRSGPRADLARRAASAPSARHLTELAAFAGVTPHRLRAWAEAWSLGGDPAVAVIADDLWSTDSAELERARERLVEAGFSRRSVALNYDSLRLAGNVWLVLGPDGRWYRLRGSGKHQDLELAAPPSSDVVDLVDAPGASTTDQQLADRGNG